MRAGMLVDAKAGQEILGRRTQDIRVKTYFNVTV